MYTPLDNGCIMNSVNRQSILDMSDEIDRDIGLKVVERPISIHEVISAFKEERLIEMIGVSTSAFVQPINRLVYRDQSI